MSEIRVTDIKGEDGSAAVTFSKGINVTSGVITATTFSGSGASLTSIPAGNLTGTVADARISTLTASKLTGALPAISGANLTGISTPLVAYKAKEFLRQRYSFSNSSWSEIDSNFRVSHTPAATGNTIICAVQIWHTMENSSYGGFTIVTDQGSNSDEAMFGETSTSGAVQKGSILGGTYHNEMLRNTNGGNMWMGSHMWGYHVTENTNAHVFKFYGRMGNGTRFVGDNQMGQFMQIWEYQGNVMQ